MKKRKFLFSGILCLLMALSLAGTLIFTGCSITQKDPVEASPCYGLTPDESKICSVIANPQDVAVLLKLANIVALKKELYKAEKALYVLDSLVVLLSDTDESGEMTYSELYALFDKYIDPLVFVVLDDYRKQFVSLEIALLPADRAMVLKHLKDQIILLELFLAENHAFYDIEDRSRDKAVLIYKGPILTGTNG